MINYMICLCCGGTIELENDSEGVCDICETRVIAGEIIKDTAYTENEIEPTARRKRKSYTERVMGWLEKEEEK